MPALGADQGGQRVERAATRRATPSASVVLRELGRVLARCPPDDRPEGDQRRRRPGVGRSVGSWCRAPRGRTTPTGLSWRGAGSAAGALTRSPEAGQGSRRHSRFHLCGVPANAAAVTTLPRDDCPHRDARSRLCASPRRCRVRLRRRRRLGRRPQPQRQARRGAGLHHEREGVRRRSSSARSRSRSTARAGRAWSSSSRPARPRRGSSRARPRAPSRWAPRCCSSTTGRTTAAGEDRGLPGRAVAPRAQPMQQQRARR